MVQANLLFFVGQLTTTLEMEIGLHQNRFDVFAAKNICQSTLFLSRNFQVEMNLKLVNEGTN